MKTLRGRKYQMKIMGLLLYSCHHIWYFQMKEYAASWYVKEYIFMADFF